MGPEERAERDAWADYDGHRIDRAELKAVLVRAERAALGTLIAEILDEWERAYPTPVFPGFERVEAASPEQIAAHMARHMARQLKQQVAAAIRARGGG